MSGSGVNKAVTKDGGAYNKLRRPDDFVTSITNTPASNEAASKFPQAADSTKRKLEEANISSEIVDNQPEFKRPKEMESSRLSYKSTIIYKKQKEKKDKQFLMGPTRAANGMFTAFPGLDDDEAPDDDTKEVFEYLRSVRSEEAPLTLLVALPTQEQDDRPDRSIYNDGRGDQRAYFSDGAWVGVNPDAAEYSEDESENLADLDPQEEYYKLLVRRYVAFRASMQAQTEEIFQQLARKTSESPTTPPPKEPPRNSKEWTYMIDREFPTPYMATLIRMDQTNLYRGLDYITRALDRFDTISKQKSCWIWTMLALVEERGLLNFWRTGVIRTLGQQAGRFGVELRKGAVRQKQTEDRDENDLDQIEPTQVEIAEGEGEGDEDSEDDAGDDEDNPIIETSAPKDEEVDVVLEIPVVPGTVADATGENSPEKSGNTKGIAEGDEADESDSGADMSMSEDEKAENGMVQGNKEAVALEEARARLLAQLGDNLVHAGIPSETERQKLRRPYRGRNRGSRGRESFRGRDNGRGRSRSPSYTRSPSPPRVRRSHRHNGARCLDLSCLGPVRKKEHAIAKQDMHFRRSKSPHERRIPSRAEAERQRQKIREQELQKTRLDDKDVSEPLAKLNSPEPPASKVETPQQVKPKVFQSRVEAEAHRLREHEVLRNELSVEQRQDVVAGSAVQGQEVSKEMVKQEHTAPPVPGVDVEMQDVQGVDFNTKATIDMILTVVAECYGQRDLLAYRDMW